MHSVFIMKLPLPLVLFLITFYKAESKKHTDDNTICVERGDALKLLYGHEGRPGLPGSKGDQGPKGQAAMPGSKGSAGRPGAKGLAGPDGLQGSKGEPGAPGVLGVQGETGVSGVSGDKGYTGLKGMPGEPGQRGRGGWKGDRGVQGKPGAKMEKNMEIYVLNDYFVAQSGYYNKLYHVKSRDLTDGRTNTGGWGSETAKTGNYVQATYIRPVNVTSVTVAGGYIPSWGHDVRRGCGKLDLEYSLDGKSWLKVKTFPTPVEKRMIFYDLIQPITAQYWRLKSAEDKWVGVTEFALKPLITS